MSFGRLAGRRIKWMLLPVIIVFCLISFSWLGGLKCYSVVSGSMNPSVPVGSAIFIKARPPGEIRNGEIITYCMGQGKTVITHRVVENNKKKRQFITKGDANNSPDPKPVNWENLQGQVVFCVPFAGYVLNFLGTRNGKLAEVFLLLACYLATEIFEGKI